MFLYSFWLYTHTHTTKCFNIDMEGKYKSPILLKEKSFKPREGDLVLKIFKKYHCIQSFSITSSVIQNPQ